ncbi:MAG TPA: ABC transporter substrate-binding protein [Actinomycetes bacterium]|nr:ABC transporter substrate-binding protein [Actinomycetes bacterium]
MRQSVGRRSATRVAVVAGLLAVALTAGACQGDEAPPGPAARGDTSVVVASFSFPESGLLAEIYAQALEAAGVPVRREPDLGPRELVLPALRQGLVDVVPEYLGTALATVAPGVDVDIRDVAAVRAALDRSLLRWGLRTLRPAAASNQNGLVVERTTARRLGLRSVSDLRPVARDLTLGMTPECPTRQYCLLGLRRVYGLTFGDALAFDTESQRAQALDQQVVDVALMFTTDGRLAVGDLVVLADDRNLQPAENVVPVVSTRVVRRYGDRLVQTLERVSARLTTANLVFLNWRVSVAGKDVAGEARGWLRRHDLLTPSR